MATWHGGECGVCGLAGMVTEPRDFGHLTDGWQNLCCRGCGAGEGHEYTTCDRCGREICPDCEADINDDDAPVNLCDNCGSGESALPCDNRAGR
jgi:predicted amidophosphoribosyltransferase